MNEAAFAMTGLILLIGVLVPSIGALVSAVQYDADVYARAGFDRRGWVVMLSITIWIVPFGAGLGLLYFVMVWPQLRRARRQLGDETVLMDDDLGSVLVVDLSDTRLGTLRDVFGALRKPLDLPEWFGNNLDAWHDALNGGGISAKLDAASHLRLVVRDAGVFAAGNVQGAAFEEVCVEEGRASISRVA